ncbi:inositol 1,3,4-trisphosphate 5/6-kinase 4 [Ricinus communis]|uniref:inositol-1,3,4-trisphosphate 5/6-kinase n=1 Tax=Ricinus communis TaxID=3988 RepID=B9SSZ4_RICCO|nr:inositol 1,3,4-trisphosphate 5/6-kinase 4 [Ricinus communis]EEF33297.1 Inositol-tetrakisphosphate 1-kinase, putative [Ricinus communis]|eukprot:XP_002529113.1 inositol 1,3,4-trisphosphate 5/6-kinase 4 [Ricinus communis]
MDALFVGGIILDESVLLDDNSETAALRSSAVSSLLRKLRHSKLHLGISYSSSLSHDKVNLLKNTAIQYSFDCFVLDGSNYNDAITLAWGDNIGGSVLYVVSKTKNHTFSQVSNLNWMIIVVDPEGVPLCGNSKKLCISRVEELFLTISLLNRKVIGNNIVTVGYIMKPSREEDFAKRGAFPMSPTPNGLMFMPLTFELPLLSQLQHVDIVLHKATDEIISVELTSSTESSNSITYTTGMQELQRYMEHHSGCFVIDPLDKIYPVLDRLKIQQILLGLENLNTEGRHTIRGPHFLKVNDFNEPDLAQRLSEAKLSLPSIVKPQIACGVADAHSMAIVFKVEDFKDLSVPLPAVVQEYVDHSSTLFKIYVLGEKVFYAVKKSTPNVDILMKLSEKNGLGPLIFDSLKSLPTGSEDSCTESHFDIGLVTDAANWLARKLDLTIFGFDVVIQEDTHDHVIVDVNYLPSFKEVPNDVCIPAFWDAIKKKLESREKI